jgi:hypothetical protein
MSAVRALHTEFDLDPSLIELYPIDVREGAAPSDILPLP